MPLQETGGWRQHGANHECRHHWKKERLRNIENGDHANNQEGDQGEGHNLCTANDRRKFGLAIGKRCTSRGPAGGAFVGKGTQLILPPHQRECAFNSACDPESVEIRDTPANPQPDGKFHR